MGCVVSGVLWAPGFSGFRITAFDVRIYFMAAIALSSLFNKFSKDDNLLAFDTAFNLFVVIRIQINVLYQGSPLGRKIGSFYIQILDHSDTVTGIEFCIVAIKIF